MCKFKIGDVVYAPCIFGERDGTKSRPCIIVALNPDCRYHLVECYTLLDKHKTIASQNVIEKIVEGSEEFSNLGFENDTVITKNHGWLSENLVRSPPSKKPNPIGFCSFVDRIKKALGIP